MMDTRLVGAWELVDAYVDGATNPIVVGTKKIYSVSRFWRRCQGLESIIFNYTAAADSIPHEINHVCTEGDLRGIYKFEDGRLVTCFAEDVGNDRPTCFDYSAESGWNMGIWHRLPNVPTRSDGVAI